MSPLSLGSTAVFLFLLTQLARPASVAAQDYSSLYDQQTLLRTAAVYTKNLRGLWEEDLLGRLTIAERKAVAGIRLDLPLIGRHKHPLDYYANPLTRRVTIPILSVKFLDDIAITTAWLERRGCDRAAVLDYVGMIQYRQPAELPEGHFPSPLAALKVPDNALNDPFVDDVSQKILKSSVYFLMAHELAHVMYGHQGYETIQVAQAQEQESDLFAVRLMRRIAVAPLGMPLFFLAASRFEQAPGDFNSLSEYETYLHSRATHPITSQRLLSLATEIGRNPEEFAALQPNPGAWRARIVQAATDIRKIGEILDNREFRNDQRRRSRQITLSSLAAACP